MALISLQPVNDKLTQPSPDKKAPVSHNPRADKRPKKKAAEKENKAEDETLFNIDQWV